MSDRREVSQNVNILVLDGGGASGLSSLIILDEVMKRLQHHIGLSEPPHVWDYFDIVAGTGTGAVAVCMLGRLRVPLRLAIDYYQRLTEVFSDRKMIGTTAFKTTKLQEVLKGVVRDVTGDENTRMMDTSANSQRCKTMVFAMSKHNMNAGIPCIFRSYQGVANQIPDCAIWEALYASMAHPELFKSIEIGHPPTRESFVDGGLGCTNPTAHVLAEAKALDPNGHLACVVSIGAGRTNPIQIPVPSFLRGFLPANALAVMRNIVADGERVAQEISARFSQTSDIYFRFSADQSMQNWKLGEWEGLGKVTANTRAYMRRVDTSARVDRAVKAIEERKAAATMAQIGGEIEIGNLQQIPGLKLYPAPTPVFTGREDKVKQITRCLSQGYKQRCVFVLHGLGGAGKTQIALKSIERTRDMWTDIVYVDATSRDTATKSLGDFAKSKQIGDTHEDTIRWLGGRQERWLMVFDNADDPGLHVRDMFPLGNHGSIIITTRIPDLAMLAQGAHSDIEVSSMQAEEAMELLLKTARVQLGEVAQEDYKVATQLLEDLGHLALAVVHAGAYIWATKRTIPQYREMFLKERKQTLDKYTRLLTKVDSYQWSVYTTWHMSYERLSTRAKQLLWLMAYMHHDGISEEIFRRAADWVHEYQSVIPASGAEMEVHAYVKAHLESYLDSNNSWDSAAFLDVTTELMSYSLLSYDRVDSTYRLHVLVHDWASTVIPHSQAIAVEHTMFLLAVSVDFVRTAEDYIYKRALGAHVDNVLAPGAQPSANNAEMFAEVYYRLARWDKAETMQTVVVDARRQKLGEDHLDTLRGKDKLAYIYQIQGRYHQAEILYLQVLGTRKRVLGEGHTDTLATMHALASGYQFQSEYEQAETLFSYVLNIRKQVLGERHIDTLTTMHCLASTYTYQNRYEQAETLLSQVLCAMKQALGEHHPSTLAAMRDLISTYSGQGRHDQAETLYLQVLNGYRRTFGERHPETLLTEQHLACTYWSQGRREKAVALFEQVLEAMKQTLGEQHPNTLDTMRTLASAYQRLGRLAPAEILLLQVLGVWKRDIGRAHPKTLRAMKLLAIIYCCQGIQGKFEAIRVEIRELEAGTGMV